MQQEDASGKFITKINTLLIFWGLFGSGALVFIRSSADRSFQHPDMNFSSKSRESSEVELRLTPLVVCRQPLVRHPRVKQTA